MIHMYNTRVHARTLAFTFSQELAGVYACQCVMLVSFGDWTASRRLYHRFQQM